MAKVTYGSWDSQPGSDGLMMWRGLNKETFEIDCASLVGGKDVWDSLSDDGQWLVGYGIKQKVDDGLAGRAQSYAHYLELKGARVAALESGDLLGGIPTELAQAAIARILNAPIERVRKTWAKTSRAERKALCERSNVKLAMETIRGERAAERNKHMLNVTAGLEDFDIED